MAHDRSYKPLNPNVPEFSPATIPSPKKNTGEVSVNASRSQSSSNSVPTPPETLAQHQRFFLPPYLAPLGTYPYSYQGTTYYTLPPPLPPSRDGWVPLQPSMHQNVDSSCGTGQGNGLNHHPGNGPRFDYWVGNSYSSGLSNGNGYAQSFSTGYNSPYSSPYYTGYTTPYNNGYHNNLYNYNYSNAFPFFTPYTNGHANPDLFAPFTNQISQVHGIRSGLLGQQSTVNTHNGTTDANPQGGNGEWKKKKKNKRNKRKKYGKGKGKKKDEQSNSGDDADASEALDETNGNGSHQDEVCRDKVNNNNNISNGIHGNGEVAADMTSDGEVDGESSGHSVDAKAQSNGKTSSLDRVDSVQFFDHEGVSGEVKNNGNGNGVVCVDGDVGAEVRSGEK